MLQYVEKSDSCTTKYNPFSSEIFWVVVILLIILFFGFAQAIKLPVFLDTWWDEILFVDPAANLYFGQGFNSSAWFAQPKDEFWAGYPPLYPVLLYLWMLIFGFSLSVARSLNYVLIAFSSFILWKAVSRLQLIRTAQWRMLLLVLLIISVGNGFDFRPGRPDALMVALSVTALLAYSISRKRIRYLCLIFLSSIFPFSGLGLIAYTFIVSSLVLSYLRFFFLKDFIAIIIGLTIGISGLCSFYIVNGVWQGFVTSVLTNSSLSLPGPNETFTDKILLSISRAFDCDRTFKLLLISLLVMTVYKLIKGELKFQDSFGLVAGFGIPFTMRTIGSYPLYYGWMAYLPVAIYFFSQISTQLRLDVQRWLRPAVLGFAIVLLLFSSPLNLHLFFANWRSLDYSVIDSFVSENINKDDWVMADPLVYYALKKKVEVLFHPFYMRTISEKEKERISVIITKPSSLPSFKVTGDFETISNKLGGSWTDTGHNLVIQTTKSLLSAERIELRIYRKSLHTPP